MSLIILVYSTKWPFQALSHLRFMLRFLHQAVLLKVAKHEHSIFGLQQSGMFMFLQTSFC